MSRSHWRIRPTPYVEYHVQQIALKEGRSLSNTLHKLLTEAIDARQPPRPYEQSNASGTPLNTGYNNAVELPNSLQAPRDNAATW